MLLTLAGVLVVLWILGLAAFNITSGLLHLILIVAVILLIIHFVQARRI